MTSQDNDLDAILNHSNDLDTRQKILAWHQKEIKAAVREATQRCHDAMFPYEPDEPCPYCMCEAESIQHEALIECQEQLKQEGINPQGEGQL